MKFGKKQYRFGVLLIVLLLAMVASVVGKELANMEMTKAESSNYQVELSNTAESEGGLALTIVIANPSDETLVLDTTGLVIGEEDGDELAAGSNQAIDVTVDVEKQQLTIKTQAADEPLRIESSMKKEKATEGVEQGKVSLSIDGTSVAEQDFQLYQQAEILTYEELEIPTIQTATTRNARAIGPQVITQVATWADFAAAISDATTTVIQLTADIANPTPTVDPYVATLSKNLEIIGVDDTGQPANRVINFGNSYRTAGAGIVLSSGITTATSLSLKNVEFRGMGDRTADNRLGNALLYSAETNGLWSVNFEDFVYNKGLGNTKRIMYAPTATATFRGQNNLIASDYGTAPNNASGQTSVGTDWQRMFEVKSFVLTDAAHLQVDLVDMLYYSTFSGTDRTNGAQFRVEQGSTLEGSNQITPLIAVEGSYFNFYTGVDDGSAPSTVKLSGTTRYRDRYGGLICVEGPNAHYSVANGSLLDLDGRWSPVTVMMSDYGVFDVDEASTFNASVQSDNGYTLGGTIRFRLEGHMTFNIKNNSVLRVEKEDINASGAAATANRGAAIRMYGGDNVVNVSGQSRVYVQSNSNEYAIEYDTSRSMRNAFNLVDARSMVDIDSYRSGGIISDYAVNIIAESGTEFQVASSGSGYTFNYGTNSTLEFDNMLYYDFRNNNHTRVFNGTGVMRSVNSDMSVWRIGNSVNLDGDPAQAFTLGDVGFSRSAQFNTVAASFAMELLPGLVGTSFASTTEMYNFFNVTANRMQNYARVSGNNAYPIVDELRVSTDADKYIYGHVSIPEGVEGIRDAWTDEVTVEVRVTKPDSTSYVLTGVTSANVSVYGETARNGMFTIENIVNGNTEFIEAGSEIEVLRAWRGTGDPDSGQVHVGTPAIDERWVQTPITAVDVTPPTIPTPTITADQVTNASRTLSGSDAEPGATGYIGVKSATAGDTDEPTFLPETFTVQPDGTWSVTVSDYFVAGEKVSIFFNDNAGEASTVVSPPSTNNTTGNINPYQTISYHDATFTGVTEYVVEDIMPDIAVDKTVVSSSADGTTSVGDRLTYTIVVSNSRGDGVTSTLNDVTVTDIIPDFLTLDETSITGNINGTTLESTDYSFENGTLTFSAGTLLSQETATISFTTVVESDAYNTTITNTVNAEGKTIPGDSLTASSSVVNPGGVVLGTVEIVRAPSEINFGQIEYRAQNIRVNEANIIGDDLEVSDTRGASGQTAWEIKATVEKPMTLDGGSHVLANALHYQYGDSDLTLLEDQSTTVYQKSSGGSQNISSAWSADGDGLKLDVQAIDASRLGDYQGTILWTLEVSPP